MDFLAKIGEVLLIVFFVYLWNKFIVTTLIKKVTGFHKKYNSKNINKQPVKFAVDNELNIIKYTQYFYWFGCLLISIEILFN
ncbi:hypothetical protein SAMN05216503_1749 [Polaribacter sp. KT25b]|uniref:hypothetical protein n=1 Tax=Polaribacter sp. KT25b TaxID=1855336 RepID=UPI00087BA922|nr:hypothetical protein [Polaribacter sp. KT25b]SDS03078.1 hypothetical protein SAMN05216503_1749 [Polaribacter sp. KT25b]